MRLHHRDAVFIHLDALYPWFFSSHTHTHTNKTNLWLLPGGYQIFFSLLLLGSWTNNKMKSGPLSVPAPNSFIVLKKTKAPSSPPLVFVLSWRERGREESWKYTQHISTHTHTHSNNKIKKYFWFFLFNSSQRVRLNLRPNFRWSPRPSMCSLRSQHSILRICVSGLVRAWSSERPEMMKFSFYFCFCCVLFVFDCFRFFLFKSN